MKIKAARRKINNLGAKMQREEEETNETNSRKRVSNESPDYSIQPSHCLCCSGQGGKPVCFLWYCLGYKRQADFPPTPVFMSMLHSQPQKHVRRKSVLRRARAGSGKMTRFRAE